MAEISTAVIVLVLQESAGTTISIIVMLDTNTGNQHGRQVRMLIAEDSDNQQSTKKHLVSTEIVWCRYVTIARSLVCRCWLCIFACVDAFRD